MPRGPFLGSDDSARLYGQETQAPIIAARGIKANTTGNILLIVLTLFSTVSCRTVQGK